MSNFELILPNLSVDVEVASGSFVVIRQPTTTLNRSAIPIQNIAEMAITASYAATASNALVAVTALNANIPQGTVSSSQQIINYNRFATTGSNTFKATQILSASVSWSNGLTLGIDGDNTILTAPMSGSLIIFSGDGNRELSIDNSSITVTDLTGSFSANELILPVFEPPSPGLGSTYFDNQSIYVYDGTQYIQYTSQSNGGAANTGDITFNGIQIIGAGTASGDGNGYSTLELVPDSTLYGNNQYLIIDPTAPSHIHIRAGGPQDNSTAQLILGGEYNYTRVVDGGGVRLNNAVFTANTYQFIQSTDYDTAVWSTDESGNHWFDINITNPSSPTRSSTPFDVPFYSFTQYPINKVEVYDGVTFFDLFSNGQAYTLGNQYQLRIGVTQAPPSNPLNITQLTFTINTLNESALILENNDLDLYVTNNAYVYANQNIQLTTGTGSLQITTDDNSTSKTWYFTPTGELQFPDNTLQRTAFTTASLATTGSNTFKGNQIVTGSLKVFTPSATAFGYNENPTPNNIFWSYPPNDTNTQVVQVGWTAQVQGGGTYTVTNVQVDTPFAPFISITLSDPSLTLGYRTLVNFSVSSSLAGFNTNGTITFPDNTTQTTAFTGIVLPTSSLASPQTGSMYFSGSYIYVYDGTQYRSASLN